MMTSPGHHHPSLDYISKRYNLRVGDNLFYFDKMDDRDKVCTALVDLATEERDKP